MKRISISLDSILSGKTKTRRERFCRRFCKINRNTRWLSKCCKCYIEAFGGHVQSCDSASVQVKKINRSARFLCSLGLVMVAILAPAFASPQLPPAGNNTQSGAATSSLQDAQALIQQGRFEEARKILNEQLAIDPSSVEAYNLLGIAYTDEKDFDHAIDAFQQALKLAPDATKIHNNLGNLYVAQKKFDLAEKEFTKVLSVAPSNRDANYNLGLLLMAKGAPVAAIQRFQRVRPLTSEPRFNLVRAYLEAGKTPEALQTAREPSAAHKRDVQLHFTLGVVLATAKQYKLAQLELEQANALQPAAFEILHNLGTTYLRGHAYAPAALTLTRPLTLKPDSAETLYLLAQVYSEQSRPVDALDLLVHAHKVAPQNTDVIFLMARVSMTQNYFEDAIPLLEAGLKIAPHRVDLQTPLRETDFLSGKPY